MKYFSEGFLELPPGETAGDKKKDSGSIIVCPVGTSHAIRDSVGVRLPTSMPRGWVDTPCFNSAQVTQPRSLLMSHAPHLTPHLVHHHHQLPRLRHLRPPVCVTDFTSQNKTGPRPYQQPFPQQANGKRHACCFVTLSDQHPALGRRPPSPPHTPRTGAPRLPGQLLHPVALIKPSKPSNPLLQAAGLRPRTHLLVKLGAHCRHLIVGSCALLDVLCVHIVNARWRCCCLAGGLQQGATLAALEVVLRLVPACRGVKRRFRDW